MMDAAAITLSPTPGVGLRGRTPWLKWMPRRGSRSGSTSRVCRTVRLLRLCGQFLVAWIVLVAAARHLGRARRQQLARRWAERTLAILNIDVSIRGEPPGETAPLFTIANHVSWLDICALNAFGGGRFVAKAEVRAWPVIGGIAERAGTVFHVRGNWRDAARTKERLAAVLRTGEATVVFPEGTTTDGTTLGRFYPAFFQAAVDTGIPVQPVAIRYCSVDGTPSRAAIFIDEMSFATSLRRILREPAIRAELVFLPRLTALGTSRRALAREAHMSIARALGLPCGDGGGERRSSPHRRAA